MPNKTRIKGMFDNIAGSYDFFNHLTSLSVDKRWRQRSLRAVKDGDRPLALLDVACGTGDSSIAAAKYLPDGSHVTGVDLSAGMLAVMREKVAKAGLEDKISVEEGDGENLRFEDCSFDRITIDFGIRNFEDRAKGLGEMRRVLKHGGKLVILELSRPENKVLRWLYDLYFMHIMPAIGGKISGDKAAYSYLPASVKNFPGRKEFSAELAAAGFTAITHRALTLGLCRLYTAVKE